MHQYRIECKDRTYTLTLTAAHFTLTQNGDLYFENADQRGIAAFEAGSWIRVTCTD